MSKSSLLCGDSLSAGVTWQWLRSDRLAEVATLLGPEKNW